MALFHSFSLLKFYSKTLVIAFQLYKYNINEVSELIDLKKKKQFQGSDCWNR